MVESVAALNTSRSAATRQNAAALVNAASDTSKNGQGTQAAPFISPRLRTDPTVGKVVIEFLDSHSGEVSSQIPSQAAIAYLRAGLTANGTRENQDRAVA